MESCLPPKNDTESFETYKRNLHKHFNRCCGKYKDIPDIKQEYDYVLFMLISKYKRRHNKYPTVCYLKRSIENYFIYLIRRNYSVKSCYLEDLNEPECRHDNYRTIDIVDTIRHISGNDFGVCKMLMEGTPVLEIFQTITKHRYYKVMGMLRRKCDYKTFI